MREENLNINLALASTAVVIVLSLLYFRNNVTTNNTPANLIRPGAFAGLRSLTRVYLPIFDSVRDLVDESLHPAINALSPDEQGALCRAIINRQNSQQEPVRLRIEDFSSEPLPLTILERDVIDLVRAIAIALVGSERSNAISNLSMPMRLLWDLSIVNLKFTGQNSRTGLFELGNDLLTLIMSGLTIADVISLMRTTKKFGLCDGGPANEGFLADKFDNYARFFTPPQLTDQTEEESKLHL